MADEKLLTELKAKHGDELVELTAASGEVVIAKPPNRPTWKRFQAQILDEKKRSDAVEHLVRACIVHPDAPTLDVMLSKKPGLVETFSKPIAELAGASQEVEKKLL